MILVDTSVWVEHLKAGDPALAELLEGNMVLTHPFVLGELALGSLKNRSGTLPLLDNLPKAQVADHAEVRAFIETERLWSLGVGYTDVHLLAAVRLTANSALWTYDKRLGKVADRLRLGWKNAGAR